MCLFVFFFFGGGGVWFAQVCLLFVFANSQTCANKCTAKACFAFWNLVALPDSTNPNWPSGIFVIFPQFPFNSLLLIIMIRSFLCLVLFMFARAGASKKSQFCAIIPMAEKLKIRQQALFALKAKTTSQPQLTTQLSKASGPFDFWFSHSGFPCLISTGSKR